MTALEVSANEARTHQLQADLQAVEATERKRSNLANEAIKSREADIHQQDADTRRKTYEMEKDYQGYRKAESVFKDIKAGGDFVSNMVKSVSGVGKLIAAGKAA